MSQKPFGDRSDIMTPVSDDTMALAAMIEAMRAATRAMERVEQKLGNVEGTVSGLVTEIAVINTKDENSAWMAQELNSLAPRIAALELRNAEQNGAMKFSLWLKDFGPWIATTVLVGYTLFAK